MAEGEKSLYPPALPPPPPFSSPPHRPESAPPFPINQLDRPAGKGGPPPFLLPFPRPAARVGRDPNFLIKHMGKRGPTEPQNPKSPLPRNCWQGLSPHYIGFGRLSSPKQSFHSRPTLVFPHSKNILAVFSPDLFISRVFLCLFLRPFPLGMRNGWKVEGERTDAPPSTSGYKFPSRMTFTQKKKTYKRNNNLL